MLSSKHPTLKKRDLQPGRIIAALRFSSLMAFDVSWSQGIIIANTGLEETHYSNYWNLHVLWENGRVENIQIPKHKQHGRWKRIM